MIAYSNTRYLESKRTVDDRALNRGVVDRLRAALATRERLAVTELGAGIGTMVSRAVDWGLVRKGRYTLVDSDAEAAVASRTWLRRWAGERGYAVKAEGDAIRIAARDLDLAVHWETCDVHEFLKRNPRRSTDLLVANAFLDLVDVRGTLPLLLEQLADGGLYWFSVNFDGETIFTPEDPADDELLGAYHASMDRRVQDGRRAGHSKTGRRLFEYLREAGANILAAGPSDWVVFANDAVYEADEAYFLHHIVHTVDQELGGRADIDETTLSRWVALRDEQIEAGTLVYVAHQLDFVGSVTR